MLQSSTELISDTSSISLGPNGVKHCLIRVSSLVLGFRRVSLDGGRVLSIEELDLPTNTFETSAVRFDVRGFDSEWDDAKQVSSLHALEHALGAVAPIVAGCDRGDLGSSWYTLFFESASPAVFIFDQVPGGVGLASALFENVKPWITAARQLLTSCRCIEGCPGCLLSARCEAGNEHLSKAGAVALLDSLS